MCYRYFNTYILCTYVLREENNVKRKQKQIERACQDDYDVDDIEHLDENMIFTNGPAGLAYMVIKQWIKDGRPKSSKETIDVWRDILKYAMSLKEN